MTWSLARGHGELERAFQRPRLAVTPGALRAFPGACGEGVDFRASGAPSDRARSHAVDSRQSVPALRAGARPSI